ncbi:CapA family protein [Peterkaempfera griseoplana]|uniref:CapA family protein n=1 Tax=Peterkaempfera griseoplana TaxID=66896 RepID=UPI0006E40FDE|nr:CapA family protein [Peterkaempfera griseoplana]
MAVTVALAGDTMLGRGVARCLAAGDRARELFGAEVREAVAGADLRVLNLECCVSDRGERWPQPGKRFFFRAPPCAADVLAELRVDCVTLANNHALDYGYDALTDTLARLDANGIRTVGAGPDLTAARRFRVLEASGMRLAVIGFADHPEDFAAAPGRPGTAWAELGEGLPGWLEELVREAAAEADAVLVTPHWGPNMTVRPPRYVRRAACALLDAGATLVAGHSAHVLHGAARGILHDMGDFIDDYAVHPALRNDLGMLFVVELDGSPVVPVRVEALPLRLEPGRTEAARGEEWEWLYDRFTRACSEFGTAVAPVDGRLVVEWHDS